MLFFRIRGMKLEESLLPSKKYSLTLNPPKSPNPLKPQSPKLETDAPKVVYTAVKSLPTRWKEPEIGAASGLQAPTSG